MVHEVILVVLFEHPDRRGGSETQEMERRPVDRCRDVREKHPAGSARETDIAFLTDERKILIVDSEIHR